MLFRNLKLWMKQIESGILITQIFQLQQLLKYNFLLKLKSILWLYGHLHTRQLAKVPGNNVLEIEKDLKKELLMWKKKSFMF